MVCNLLLTAVTCKLLQRVMVIIYLVFITSWQAQDFIPRVDYFLYIIIYSKLLVGRSIFHKMCCDDIYLYAVTHLSYMAILNSLYYNISIHIKIFVK